MSKLVKVGKTCATDTSSLKSAGLDLICRLHRFAVYCSLRL